MITSLPSFRNLGLARAARVPVSPLINTNNNNMRRLSKSELCLIISLTFMYREGERFFLSQLVLFSQRQNYTKYYQHYFQLTGFPYLGVIDKFSRDKRINMRLTQKYKTIWTKLRWKNSGTVSKEQLFQNYCLCLLVGKSKNSSCTFRCHCFRKIIWEMSVGLEVSGRAGFGLRLSLGF